MKKVLILSSSILLSACAWNQIAVPSGSAPVEPQPTVKQIQGKIIQGRYHSKIGQARVGQVSIPVSFSVMVPQIAQPAEYQYTRVSDQQGSHYTSARFGPGWHDQTIYRVTVSLLPMTSPFKSTAKTLLNETVKRMQTIHKIVPIKLYQQFLSLNHHQTLFSIYQQRNKVSGEVFTQAVYFWQQQHCMIECWMTGTSTSQINPVTDANRLQVVKNEFKSFNQFVRSVKIAQ